MYDCRFPSDPDDPGMLVETRPWFVFSGVDARQAILRAAKWLDARPQMRVEDVRLDVDDDAVFFGDDVVEAYALLLSVDDDLEGA